MIHVIVYVYKLDKILISIEQNPACHMGQDSLGSWWLSLCGTWLCWRSATLFIRPFPSLEYLESTPAMYLPQSRPSWASASPAWTNHQPPPWSTSLHPSPTWPWGGFLQPRFKPAPLWSRPFLGSQNPQGRVLASQPDFWNAPVSVPTHLSSSMSNNTPSYSETQGHFQKAPGFSTPLCPCNSLG